MHPTVGLRSGIGFAAAFYLIRPQVMLGVSQATSIVLIRSACTLSNHSLLGASALLARYAIRARSKRN